MLVTRSPPSGQCRSICRIGATQGLESSTLLPCPHLGSSHAIPRGLSECPELACKPRGLPLFKWLFDDTAPEEALSCCRRVLDRLSKMREPGCCLKHRVIPLSLMWVLFKQVVSSALRALHVVLTACVGKRFFKRLHWPPIFCKLFGPRPWGACCFVDASSRSSL